MAKAHDEHMAARDYIVHRCVHWRAVLALHIIRHVGGKDLITAIYPAHLAWQSAQHLDQGFAYMATAK